MLSGGGPTNLCLPPGESRTHNRPISHGYTNILLIIVRAKSIEFVGTQPAFTRNLYPVWLKKHKVRAF